jgi:hypothetical protein
MNAERMRILEMVAEGKISPSDAEQLLAAVKAKRTSPAKWLFQPLEVIDPAQASIVGGLAAIAGAIASATLGFRFDGAIDLHDARGASVSLADALIDLLLVWPVTALVFWGVARLLARQGRFVDFLAAVGLARVVYLVAGVLLGTVGRAVDDGALLTVSAAEMIVLVGLVVPLSIWSIALLVTGFRTASGLRGGRLAFGAVAAIVGAEVSTKLVLWAIASA